MGSLSQDKAQEEIHSSSKVARPINTKLPGGRILTESIMGFELLFCLLTMMLGDRIAATTQGIMERMGVRENEIDSPAVIENLRVGKLVSLKMFFDFCLAY